MMLSVKLNNETLFWAIEIHNEVLNAMLALKLATTEFAALQAFPE